MINYVDGHMEGTLNSQGDIFQMKNNRITGKVKKIMKTRNENWTMSGQFDDDGFPDGVWIKRYQSYGNLYIDTEKYVHGLLVLKQTKMNQRVILQDMNLKMSIHKNIFLHTIQRKTLL